MLEITLKHYVYDACIGIVFSNLIRNMQTDLTGVPKLGEFYSTVSHVNLNEVYHNCIVQDVEIRVSPEGRKFFMVYITYEYANGIDYDEWQEDIADLEELASEEGESEIEVDEDGNTWGVAYSAGEFPDDDDDLDMNSDTIEIVQLADMIAVNTLYYTFQK